MSKSVLVILIIALAGIFIYLRLNGPASAEEQKVRTLEDIYTAAVGRFTGSANPSGIAIDPAQAAEAAVVQIKNVQNELSRLRETLTEEKARRRADQLRAKIEEFCRKNDIF